MKRVLRHLNQLITGFKTDKNTKKLLEKEIDPDYWYIYLTKVEELWTPHLKNCNVCYKVVLNTSKFLPTDIPANHFPERHKLDKFLEEKGWTAEVRETENRKHLLREYERLHSLKSLDSHKGP